MAIGAVPFLLPLMFQVGFGLDAFHAGLLMIAVFAGNLVDEAVHQRPSCAASASARCWSATACSTPPPSAPARCSRPTRRCGSCCAVLFVGGMTRSMQFTALNTIAFADVPQTAMSGANTLFSTAFQLAMGLGVALGALAVRSANGCVAAPACRGSRGGAVPGGVRHGGLVALLGLLDCLKLRPGAGDNISGYGKPKAGS